MRVFPAQFASERPRKRLFRPWSVRCSVGGALDLGAWPPPPPPPRRAPNERGVSYDGPTWWRGPTHARSSKLYKLSMLYILLKLHHLNLTLRIKSLWIWMTSFALRGYVASPAVRVYGPRHLLRVVWPLSAAKENCAQLFVLPSPTSTGANDPTAIRHSCMASQTCAI